MCCNNIVISFWVLILTRDDTSCLTLLSCVKLICSNEFFFFFFFLSSVSEGLNGLFGFFSCRKTSVEKTFYLKTLY